MAFPINSFKCAFKGTKAVRVTVSDTTLEVWHYATCICRVTADEIELDNGGYSTRTTKRHLNTCLDLLGKQVGIFQKRFEWYLTDGKPFDRHMILARF